MLGKALQAIGRPTEAIAPLREAVRLVLSPAEAHSALGVSLAMTGHPDAAAAELREAMRLAPDWPVPMSKLAVLLATHPDPRARNPAEAIRLSQRAAELSEHRDPLILETLAASYASAGQFAEAAAVQQQALDVAAERGDETEAIRAGLEGYRRGAPLPSNLPPRPDTAP
jgi:Flp pilus assembly protein TadD